MDFLLKRLGTFRSTHPALYRWFKRFLITFLLLDFVSWWNGFGHLFQSTKSVCPGYYVGDLGGMLVKVPVHAVDVTEREDERKPLIGKMMGPSPMITWKTKFTGLRIDVNPDTGEIFMKQKTFDSPPNNFKENDQWVSVGMSAGEYYGRIPFVDHEKLWLPIQGNGYGKAVKFNSDIPGLQAYQIWVKEGYDNEYKYRLGLYRSTDVYFLEDSRSVLATYIVCGTGKNPRCNHQIDMYPEAKVRINMDYSRNLLPKWRQIEEVSKQAVRSLRIYDVSQCK